MPIPAPQWPRRRDVTTMVPAEIAIQDAIDAVEKMCADPKLTKAVQLLSEAQGLVADHVDARVTKKGD